MDNTSIYGTIASILFVVIVICFTIGAITESFGLWWIFVLTLDITAVGVAYSVIKYWLNVFRNSK